MPGQGALLLTAILLPRIPDLQSAERSFAPSKSSCQERNFWMQRPEAKNRLWTPLMCTETESPVTIPTKSAQKRPLFDRPRFPRFGRTGWWCAQSYTNRSRTRICLISGFLQGIFLNWCLLSENAPRFAALIQWLASEFPKGRNRPLSAFIRGRFSKNRGGLGSEQVADPLPRAALKNPAVSALFAIYS